jgi:hypothetical protein
MTMNMFVTRLAGTVSLLVCSAVLLLGCSDDKKSEHAAPAQTQGGESTLDRAQKDFQRDVKPAADFVDEKTREAVGEGKKAVNKVTGND